MENKFINCGEVLYMPSLKKYNTYNVDSSVKFLIFPNDVNELKNTLKIASENNLKTKIIGNGSNLVFVKDYYDIDKSYGTMEDMEQLIEECHKRGIKLIIDMVFNHTSASHPWFTEACDPRIHTHNTIHYFQPDARYLLRLYLLQNYNNLHTYIVMYPVLLLPADFSSNHMPL